MKWQTPLSKNIPSFSSFMMAGYECTYSKTKTKKFDLLMSSRHDVMCQNDYKLLQDLGISTVREGLSWSIIDKGNSDYDFSRFEKIMKVGKSMDIQQIWDLNHFDYPDYLDPFSNKFIKAFGNYALRALEKLRNYFNDTLYIIPINEISFFAWNGADVGWCAPFFKRKGGEFKKQLVKASLSCMALLWNYDKNIRFIHSDPLMRRIAKDQTNKKSVEISKNFKDTMYESWDMIAGYKNPELGGDPSFLDILGINYYWINQEYIIGNKSADQASYETMPWDSPDRVELCDLMSDAYLRYKKPMVITETGSYGKLRKKWWDKIFKETTKCLENGLPLYGICSYPTLDRPDDVELFEPQSGLWDFKPGDKTLTRIPHTESLEIIQQFVANTHV